MRDTYVQYYLQQSGSGLNDIGPIYSSYRFRQRGSGLGGIFATLFRFIRPIFAKLAPALKTTAINAGAGLINDIGNKSFKDSLRDNSKQAVKTFFNAATGQQSGSGLRRNVKKNNIKSKTNLNKVQSHIGRRKGSSTKKKAIKKRILDIFSR